MLLGLLVLGVGTPAVHAQEVAIGLEAGSTGLGGGLTLGLSPLFNLRGVAQGFSVSESFTENDITYDGEVSLLNVALLVDLHPGGGGFRVSGGVVFNRNRISGISDEEQTITVNGVDYPAELVGTLSGEVRPNAVAPYLGLGFGNAVAPGGRVRFAVDVGAFYHGRPEVTLTASPADPSLVPPRFFDDLEQERQRLQEDAEGYRVYPVLSLGISYRF